MENKEPNIKSPHRTGALRVVSRIFTAFIRVLFAALGAVLTTLIFGLIAVIFLVHENQIQLPQWAMERVSEKMSQGAPDIDISDARVSISLNKSWKPQLIFVGLSLRNTFGDEPVTLNRLDAVFSLKQAVLGKLDISEIHLDGLSLALFRGEEGALTAQLGAPRANAQPASTPFDLKTQFDSIFALPALASFKSLDVQNMTLNYQDAKNLESWTVDGGRLAVTKEGKDLSIRSDFALLSGGAAVSLVEANLNTEVGQKSASFGIKFTDLPTKALASQSPGFAWLAALDAPLSGALRGGFNENGALEPIIATLDISNGALKPNLASKPLEFSTLKTYFTYHPSGQSLTFDNVTLQSTDLSFSAEGDAFVERRNDVATSLIGQFRLHTIKANPRGLFSDAKFLDVANLDFRLLLNPFEVQLKHFYAFDKVRDLSVRGDARIGTDETGWTYTVRAMLDRLDYESLMTYWPNNFKEPQRRWVSENVAKSELSDIVYDVTYDAKNAVRTSLTFAFEDTIFTPIKEFPEVKDARGLFSSFDRRLAISLDEGKIKAPGLEAISLAGTDFFVANTKIKPSLATVNLNVNGNLDDTLGLLNQKPLSVFERTGKNVLPADGVLELTGKLSFLMKKNLKMDDVVYSADGSIIDFQMPETANIKAIKGSLVAVTLTPEAVQLKGKFQTNGTELDGQFVYDMVRQSSILNAEFAVDETLVKNIALPLPDGMLSGTSIAKLRLNLSKDAPPAIEIKSDLIGTKLSFDQLKWQKTSNAAADFVAQGTIEDGLKFENIFLKTQGLELNGRSISGAAPGEGSFEFDTFKINDLIDVEGGIGSNKKLTIRKGYFDVRPYFSSPTKRAASGEKIPAQVALDRVRVTEKVYLDNFLGEIKLGGAVSGVFTAQIGPRSKVIGTLREVRGRTGVEISSDQGGAFLKEFGAVKGATGGKLKLTLTPAKDGVSTDAFIKVDDVKIQGAPFLAELLNGISIVGLLDQLSGSGIPINEIEANFRIKEDQVILKDFTVFGPSMGITMDGYYNLKTKMMDMQGVISPIYVINGVGSLVTQKGEGLIGFNFKLKGQSGNTVLSINPLSALTPAIFRNLFRRPPPNYDE